MRSLVPVACFVVALFGSSCAAADPAPPRPIVLIIGVGPHADATLRTRIHAERDAAALYELFSDSTRLATAPERVKLLLGKPDPTGPGSAATRSDILAALDWLATNAAPDDPVLFAFFGTGGTAEGGDRVYFASDSKAQDPKTAITVGEIARTFERLPTQRVAIFLDVVFPRRGANDPDVSLGANPYAEFLGPVDAKGESIRKGRTLFLASSGTTEAADLPDRGMFRDLVVSGLRGGADTAGGEADGSITTAELAEWLDERFPRARSAQPADGRRTPHVILGARSRRTVLVREPKTAQVVDRQLNRLTELRTKGTLPDELHREATRLLPIVPPDEERRRLRKKYQELADGRRDWEAFKTERTKLRAEMTLPRKTALRFADSVLDVAENLVERSLYEPKLGVLTRYAAQGLCDALEEPLPGDIAWWFADRADVPFDDCRTALADLRERLGKRSDLADHKDVDITLMRMLGRLDPYTTYINRNAKRKFTSDTQGQFVGIGAQIRKDDATGFLRVTSPIRNGPAHKSGLRADDLIERIVRPTVAEGQSLAEPENLDTRELSLEECIAKIVGKPGTKVTLSIRRNGEKPFDLELTRAAVQTEAVFGYRRNADSGWDHMIDDERKIGYIRISTFQLDTERQFAATLKQLRDAGMTGLILDLRFNPGGYLSSSVQVADLLIADGPIVSIKPRVGAPQTYRGTKFGSLTEFPIVCLINGYSASGAEILASCLQDHRRAVICGERSYGKGSVQHSEPYEGGILKFTMARFYRSSGKSLDKLSSEGTDAADWGVRPDPKFEVKLSVAERNDLAEYQRDAEIIGSPRKRSTVVDRQLERALEHLRTSK
jgi:carboxyl-terminal processing protease